MAYELHIRRRGLTPAEPAHAITEDEWRAVVQQVERLRLSGGTPMTATNPLTAEVITIPIAPHHALFHFPDHPSYIDIANQWLPVFFFSPRGSVRFKPPADPDDPNDPLRQTAAELARRLNAEIRGDEGELYQW